jgi:sugar phosphate isomerase/epimerase
MNRREFVFGVTGFAATAAFNPAGLQAAQKSKGVSWPIGCFNRPWTNWSYQETLESTKAAGYKLTGLLSRTKAEPFIGAEATADYLAGLKKKIASSGLKANMGALRTRHDIPLEDSIREARKQVDNAKFLGLEYILSFGVDRSEQYEHFFKVMANTAAYAQDKRIKLVMKPHGGGSGASEEILRCVDKVKHPNFKIWYDAGNIIHYTGKDPVAELKPIAHLVTGFCAKDCAQLKGDVMIQFGKGKVDFRAVFATLKAAGFKGPVMVECCALDKSRDVVTANARANREFLEKVFASL